MKTEKGERMRVCFDIIPNATREIIEDVEYMEVVTKAFHGRPTRFYSIRTKDGKYRSLKYKDAVIYWVSE
jgi:hypothetical protein